MPDILQTTFEVSFENETYTFKIPGIMYDIQVAARATAVRRKAAPDAAFELTASVDFAAIQFSRYCAIFEQYLVRTTAPWPLGIADDNPDFASMNWDKPPVIDSSKFPIDRVETVYAVGGLFEESLGRFRTRRDTSQPTGG